MQWHNRQGAECPPDMFNQESFADLLGKMRQGKKEKWRENLKWKLEKGR